MTAGHRVLGISCGTDAVLHAVAPLGLAAAAGHCLVVDLDAGAPPLPGRRTLAELVEEGPRRSDLEPPRSGVAILPNGGVTGEAAADLVAEFVRRWERVVLRVGSEATSGPWPVVPVKPLIPEFPTPPGPAVYQALLPGSAPPGPGVVLPPPSRGMIRALLRGRVEPRRRWIRAWRRVWEAPWG